MNNNLLADGHGSAIYSKSTKTYIRNSIFNGKNQIRLLTNEYGLATVYLSGNNQTSPLQSDYIIKSNDVEMYLREDNAPFNYFNSTIEKEGGAIKTSVYAYVNDATQKVSSTDTWYAWDYFEFIIKMYDIAGDPVGDSEPSNIHRNYIYDHDSVIYAYRGYENQNDEVLFNVEINSTTNGYYNYYDRSYHLNYYYFDTFGVHQIVVRDNSSNIFKFNEVKLNYYIYQLDVQGSFTHLNQYIHNTKTVYENKAKIEGSFRYDPDHDNDDNRVAKFDRSNFYAVVCLDSNGGGSIDVNGDNITIFGRNSDDRGDFINSYFDNFTKTEDDFKWNGDNGYFSGYVGAGIKFSANSVNNFYINAGFTSILSPVNLVSVFLWVF